MRTRKILTKEQLLLHKNTKLYKEFKKKFPGAVNFFNYETDRDFDEEYIKSWHDRIESLCEHYKIKLEKEYFLPYTKDFFGLIHNRYDSFSDYTDPRDVLKKVVSGFNILQDCLADMVEEPA